MRMLELSFGQSLVIVDGAIANELNLRNTGNSLEIRMKDRLLSVASLVVSVSIVLGLRIEGLIVALISRSRAVNGVYIYLGQSILLLWGDHDVTKEESVVLIRSSDKIALRKERISTW